MNLSLPFSPRIAGFILLALSAVPLTVGFILAQPSLDLRMNGTRTEGVITAMTLVTEQESAGYSPTIVFKDNQGVEHTIARPLITGTPLGRVGDSIGVYYSPEDPEQARLDHWFHLWQWAGVPMAVGLVLVLAGLTELFKGRRRSRSSPG